jgi:N-acetylmuramoyl-L-alanine amidase
MNFALLIRAAVVALFIMLVLCVSTVRANMQPFAGLTIVVDPGHGGNDWGVDPAGSGLREKDVNPQIAEQLVRLLKAEGAMVLVTREHDQFVSLNARVRFANALLFRPDNSAEHGRLISIHLNSNRKSPGLRRVEVLVDPEAPGPFSLAEDLAAKLRAVTDGSVGYLDEGYPPGVHPADVAPVRWTYPRGLNVLSEAAFISNPAQARQLQDKAFIEAIARAHVEALRQELVR